VQPDGTAGGQLYNAEHTAYLGEVTGTVDSDGTANIVLYGVSLGAHYQLSAEFGADDSVIDGAYTCIPVESGKYPKVIKVYLTKWNPQ
jgi:hypothetical protein